MKNLVKSTTTPTNSPKSSPHSQHLSSPTHFSSPTSNYHHSSSVMQSSNSPSPSPTSGNTTTIINNNNTNLLNNNNSISNVYQKYTGATESQQHHQQHQQPQQIHHQPQPMTIIHTLQQQQQPQMYSNQPSSPINLHQSPPQHLMSSSPHQDQFSPIQSPTTNGSYYYDGASATTMDNNIVKIEPQTQQSHIVYNPHLMSNSVSHSPSSIEDEYECPQSQSQQHQTFLNQNLYIQNLNGLDRRHFERRSDVKLE